MKHFKIILALKENQTREKIQSEWADTIQNAVFQAERHNPGYFVKSCNEF